MAYATLQQLKDHLGFSGDPDHPVIYDQLTDRVTETTADDAVGQAILDSAEATLHSYLVGRYTVPVDVAGSAALAGMLNKYTLEVAAHLAWLTSTLSKDEPVTTKRLFDEALEWLLAVGKGEIPLPDDPAASGPGDMHSEAAGPPQVITDETIGRW